MNDIVLTSIPLPILLTVVGVFMGGMFALFKWFAARLLADIDTRLRRIDEIEDRLDKMASDLPIHYMRREDLVRELTAIHIKLDRLYEILLNRG